MSSPKDKQSATTNKQSAVCRVCGKELAEAKEQAGPFCSARCKMQDLSKWFGENYRIASSQAQLPEQDDEPES
jgi:endogenous inhibitor of DNA gyrase (YacG/DUF329 family)